MLAWNSTAQMRVGFIGTTMEVQKDLRSEKGTRIKKIVNFATGHCDFVVLAANIARWVGDEGLDEGTAVEVVVARGATELSHGEHMYAQNKTYSTGRSAS